MIEAIRSSVPNPMPGTFATYTPRPVREASGTSWTLVRYTLPRLVNTISQWWVVVVKTWLMMSSCLRLAPMTPRPPRPWLR